MTKLEGVIVGAYTGVLCGSFADLQAYIEKLLGRSVWTHELADPAVLAEIKALARPDFLALTVEDPKAAS